MRTLSSALLTAVLASHALAGDPIPCPWQPAPTAGPHAAAGFGMTYDAARSEVVLFGGWSLPFQNILNQTWVYDGSSWQIQPVVSPPARIASPLVYDGARQNCLLFGGDDANNELLGDTWTWNGQAWQSHGGVAPPERAYHAMAFDEARGEVVLFGGWDGADGDLGDTWVWNGATWTQRHPFFQPSPRDGAAMAYDEARQLVVLHGGYEILSDSYQDQTWIWNGSVWTIVLGPGPGARGYHSMTWDADREVIVLHGGWDDSSARLSDTWEFDGQHWREVTAQGAPEIGGESGVTYDLVRSRLVARGSQDGNSAGTWEWARADIEITHAPQTKFVLAGDDATLEVELADETGLVFQWERDGAALVDGNGIAGAHTSNLTIDSADFDDTGSYAVRISNACGAVVLHAVVGVLCPGDANGDGVTNFTDLNLTISNYNSGCETP